MDHSLVAQINGKEAPEEYKNISLPLDESLPLIGTHLEKQSTAEVL